MRKFSAGMAMLSLMAAVLFGCRPDNVNPTDSDDTPSLSGDVGDPHPALDTVCLTADTMFLIREDNGSPLIDKCYRRVPPGVGPLTLVPCQPADQMPWGYLEMKQGYFNMTSYVDCNFTMAPGWYCDFNNWQFGLANSFLFDQNGLPIVGTDWGVQVVNPAQNKWQLRIDVSSLPSPCFDVALRVDGLKLSLFGAPIAGSTTLLWGRNRNWNVPNHPQASTSQWLMHFCPIACLPVDTDTICQPIYVANGFPSTNCTGNSVNCTTLAPNPSLGGTLTYQWSTGATTPTLTVCPTVPTSYQVTISTNGAPTLLWVYNVEVEDASCIADQPIGALDFCTTNLNVRYNQSFNIRDYIRFANGDGITGNQWNQVRFTYTEAGANLPTNPVDWNLSAFQAGTPVLITSLDYAPGKGNVGQGQYRLFVYRQGRPTYDDYITIRVNNAQVSTINSAKCANINGGPLCITNPGNGGDPGPGIEVCYTPPGNPNMAVTQCIPPALINYYIANTCNGASTGVNGYMIGACGSNPCNLQSRGDAGKNSTYGTR